MNVDRAATAAEFGKVAVLMGGWSAEREISLRSGAAVLAALQARGVDAHGVDAGRDVIAVLERGRFERAFIALHGRGGEDGVIQGALEVLGLPYTGSGVLASAMAMDKLRTKQVLQACGVPTPAFVVVDAGMDPQTVIERVGLPLMVKPVHEGSSLGMSKVTEAGQLAEALALARRYDSEVIAERWIQGAEYTAAVLGRQLLPLVRLETPRAFYDYTAKYFADDTRYHCPSGLAAEREQAFQGVALAAFDAVGASGWGRVDVLSDAQGQPWVIEINTVPGMTDHSLVPMAARAAGIGFEALVWGILETSLGGRPAAGDTEG